MILDTQCRLCRLKESMGLHLMLLGYRALLRRENFHDQRNFIVRGRNSGQFAPTLISRAVVRCRTGIVWRRRAEACKPGGPGVRLRNPSPSARWIDTPAAHAGMLWICRALVDCSRR